MTDLFSNEGTEFKRKIQQDGGNRKAEKSALVQMSKNKKITRHRASTSMYSLKFCVRVLLPERHQCMEARSPRRRSNVENAPRRRPSIGEPATPTSHIWRTILRAPPSPASHRPAARAYPAQPAVRTMSSYRGMDASL